MHEPTPIRRQVVDRSLNIVNRPPGLALALAGRRLEYLHIPKFGGTTVRYVLEAYAGTRALTSFNEGRANPTPAISRSEARIAMGHEPAIDQYQRDDTVYMTILRDPIKRLRSHAAMLTRAYGCSPAQALKRLDSVHHNSACYILAGPEIGSAPEARLDAAKRALENRIHLFGFQERHDEAMALLAAVLDVEGLIYPGFQHGAKRGAASDNTLEEGHLATLCRYDRALDVFARELYASRWAPVFDGFALHEKRPGRRYLTIQMDTTAAAVIAGETVFRPPNTTG
ncbi:MAG: hypothetical protein HQ481_18305 [Alphaproteobacteria bacterium]|nr:hypothetical protein [Alphaproteobacteria bacterium]